MEQDQITFNGFIFETNSKSQYHQRICDFANDNKEFFKFDIENEYWIYEGDFRVKEWMIDDGYAEIFPLLNIKVVTGTIYCESVGLRCLAGFPEKCKFLFCSYNPLSSLYGMPKDVKYVEATDCEIKSLLGMSDKCKKYNLIANKLETLEYCVNNCILLDLRLNPIKCKTIYVKEKPLSFLEYLPKNVQTLKIDFTTLDFDNKSGYLEDWYL